MATTSCSKSTVMAGKIRTKYNKYTVILRHNNKSKNVLNYKCRSLSDCETSKTSIGNFFVGGGAGWGLHRAHGYGVSAYPLGYPLDFMVFYSLILCMWRRMAKINKQTTTTKGIRSSLETFKKIYILAKHIVAQHSLVLTTALEKCQKIK